MTLQERSRKLMEVNGGFVASDTFKVQVLTNVPHRDR